MKVGPQVRVMAGKAVGVKESLAPEFKIYQQQVKVNARIIA